LPGCDPLRADPRFPAPLARLGLPSEGRLVIRSSIRNGLSIWTPEDDVARVHVLGQDGEAPLLRAVVTISASETEDEGAGRGHGAGEAVA